MRMQPHNCQRDCKILMLGLDSSGKTAILYGLSTKSPVRLIPTIGFNVETLHTPQGERLTVWDISGRSRAHWGYYTHGNTALVFVVDSTDYARINDAKEALWWIFEDRPNAMTVSEIKEALDVENLPKGRNSWPRRWHVQGASALMDGGLWEGIDWLCAQIKDAHNPIVVGMSAGGKTSLLCRLVYGECIDVSTILEYNFKDVTLSLPHPNQNTRFSFRDVSGSWGYRLLWDFFARNTVGVICVINSLEESSVTETKDSLWRMFEINDTKKESVLLVFANMQDCPRALSAAEVRDLLELETMSEGRRWHVQESSVTTGEGIMEGMAWLATQLNTAS
ncbi:hypothetical protein BGX24_003053 [Mortierella sp. AD032]|nr:hypothetical protein BGX24_003053 [Mortierella sp. AD032]